MRKITRGCSILVETKTAQVPVIDKQLQAQYFYILFSGRRVEFLILIMEKFKTIQNAHSLNAQRSSPCIKDNSYSF